MKIPPFAKSLLVALALSILAQHLIWVLNALFMGASGGGLLAGLWSLAQAGGLVLAMLVLWFFAARAGTQVSAAVLAATFAVYLVADYGRSMTRSHTHRFGAAATPGPHAVIVENRPQRGQHTYHINSFGFRGPDWTTPKAAGVRRGVVIGDSMVFGSGVDDADTIDATLAARLRRAHPGDKVEVLNLGVTGSNLVGYANAYRAAAEQLSPDFAVVCVFLPNDFVEIDQQSDMDRAGLFSVATHLLGSTFNPYTFYAIAESEHRDDHLKMEFLAENVDRMARIHASLPKAPLVFLLYSHDDPRWAETVAAHAGPGAVVVAHPDFPPEYFIADDGHPTPAGNRAFAELVGDALDQLAGPAAPRAK